MSSWEEVIGQSGAWDALAQFEDAVAEIRSGEAGADPDVLARPARLVAVARARLKGLDPDFAYEDLLVAIHNAVDSLTSALQQWAEYGDSYLPQVETAADNLAAELARIPEAGDVERVAIVESLRQDVTSLRELVQGWVNSARTQMDATVAAYEAAVHERDQSVTALDARLAELSGAMEAVQANADSFINSQTRAVESLTGNLQQRVDRLIETHTQQHVDAMEKRSAEHAEVLATTKDRSAALIAEMERRKDEAEKIVGAVARTGLAAGYGEWEKAEHKSADWMRMIAIVFGLLTAASIIIMLSFRSDRLDSGKEVDLALALSALALPGALGGVAAYAGREASKHRQNQVVARRTELELASFGAYIANLPDTEQRELTALFAAVFFGQATATVGHKVDDGPKVMSQEVLGQLSEVLKSRVKPEPPG